MKQINFYHTPICPRCVRVRGILKEIREEYPDVKINYISSLVNVISRKIYTLPAIEISDSFIYGRKITKEAILKELGIF